MKARTPVPIIRGKAEPGTEANTDGWPARRTAKFNGVKRSYFYYFLKESEFRYNCRVLEKDFYKEVLKILRKFTP